MDIKLGKNNEEIKNLSEVEQVEESAFDELRENKKLRTANSKVFCLPNGDYRKIVYAKNIHYFNEDDKAYRTIDNTLVPIMNEESGEIVGYENLYNSCKVHLAQKLDSKKLMSISKGEYNISWELIDTQFGDTEKLDVKSISKARKINKMSAAQLKNNNQKVKAVKKEIHPDNLDSEVIYKNAFDKADLQYAVHSNIIKENIIIKEQSENYEFAFKIKTTNLSVKLSDDKQRLKFCSASGEDIFRIPMPLMQDASGAVSSSIYYDISNCDGDDNVFIFKIVADSKWINSVERVLPVTIDPMIDAGDWAVQLQSKYANNKNLELRGIGVNNNTNNGINRLFLKFEMPNFGKDIIVNSAKLTFGLNGSIPEKFKGLVVYRLASNRELKDITFDTPYVNTALDMVQFLSDNVAAIDLTEYFENVHYKGKYDEQHAYYPDNGIVVKAINESLTENNFVEFDDNFCLTFDYRVNSGMHKNQAYTTNDLGRSGVSQVNLRMGSLTFVHQDINIEGNRFPVNISNVYNGFAVNGGYAIGDIQETSCPKFATNGWKFNYQQFLIPEIYTCGKIVKITRYRYIDGEGTTHYLTNTGNDMYDAVFVDEDGLGLSTFKDYPYNPEDATITDSQQNKMIFENYRLTKIITRGGDETIITYRDNNDSTDIAFYQIASIKIGSDKLVTFEYSTLDMLLSITCNNEKITYSYDYYKRLSTITYPDGNKTQLTYTSDNALASVTDVSGKKLTYTYKETQPFMVNSIKESSVYSVIDNQTVTSGSMTGASLKIDYISKNLVRTTNEKNVITMYSFDSAGNAKAVFENESASMQTMSPVSDIAYSSGDENHSVSCTISPNNTNYILAQTYTIDAGESENSKIKFFSADLFQEGQTWVLSGFAKADSATIDEDDLGSYARTFELNAVVSYGSYAETYHAKFDSHNTSWQTAATAFKIKKGITGVTVYASYLNNINSAQFNNIKFNKCSAAMTDKKICLLSDPTVYFDAKDITNTKYYLKSDQLQHTHYKKVKFSDFSKMFSDLQSSEIITVRANGGKNLISQAYDVSFTFKGNKQYALRDLGIKNITTTDRGTIETEYDPYLGNTGVKYCIYDGSYSQYGKVITFDDIKGIEYEDKQNSTTVLVTDIKEKDVYNTVMACKKWQYIVYYNDCKSAIQLSYGSPINIKTKDGKLYSAIYLTPMNFSATTKVIIDGDKKYTSTVRYDGYGQKIWEKDARGKETEYSYDNYGNLLSVRGLHNDYNLVTFDEWNYGDGNHLSTEYDNLSSGEFKSNYNSDELLSYTTTPKSQRTDYSYDKMKNLTKISSNVQNASGTSVTNSNTFSYNKDYLTQVSHNGLNYNFTYSGLGDITEIEIAGKPVLETAITRAASGDTQTTMELDSQGNQVNTAKVESDRYGKVKSVTRNDEVVLQNTYSNQYSSGRLLKSVDKLSGITYNYNYDNDGEVTEVLYSGERSGKISTVKDSKKRVSQQTNSFADGISLTYNYTYENYPDDRISKVSLVSRFTQTIAYNKLDRTSQITTKSNGAFSLTEKYTYLCPYRTVMESQYVGGVTYTIGTKTEEDNYEYDAGGNISSITTARGKTQYEYDGLNRLVQEVNNVTGKKYNYTYDAGGNILTKKITDLESGAVQEQLTYYYDSVYKDRLVDVNGQSISGYDLLGRPTTYLGTSLTWENGRVSKFVKNGKATTCKYNADGIRTEKTYSGIIHKYYLEDNTIVRESVSGNDDYEMLFMYGQNGIVGFTCNNINYYYRKNLLGDIVAIYNESGTKLCEYAYDAWGNCTILCDTNGIGALNPFRYRGYYWDSELNLYYLNARYYDPAICRFISQDNISYLDPETLNGLNLYAYCGNNPINGCDSTGHSWDTFWSGVGDWFQKHWVEVVIGTAFILGGAVVSALTCGAGTTFWAAFGSALLSSVIQVGASVAISVGVNGLVNIANGNDFFDNVGDTIASAYMWGGIFSGGSQMLSGGARFLRTKGFKGINSTHFGFMSPDKLYHKQPGMTLFRIGSRDGIKLAVDLGRYGIHAHLFSNLHTPLIPALVGLIEAF